MIDEKECRALLEQMRFYDHRNRHVNSSKKLCAFVAGWMAQSNAMQKPTNSCRIAFADGYLARTLWLRGAS